MPKYRLAQEQRGEKLKYERGTRLQHKQHKPKQSIMAGDIYRCKHSQTHTSSFTNIKRRPRTVHQLCTPPSCTNGITWCLVVRRHRSTTHTENISRIRHTTLARTKLKYTVATSAQVRDGDGWRQQPVLWLLLLLPLLLRFSKAVWDLVCAVGTCHRQL